MLFAGDRALPDILIISLDLATNPSVVKLCGDRILRNLLKIAKLINIKFIDR